MTKAQKTKLMKELSEQINVRNHVQMLVNGPRNALIAGERVNLLTKFISEADKEIIDAALSMSNPVAVLPKLVKDEVMTEARKIMKTGKTKTKMANQKAAASEKSEKSSKGAARRGVVQRVLD